MKTFAIVFLLSASALASPVKITLVDAEVAAVQKNGKPWDEPAKEVPSVLSRLVCAALPSLVSRAASCGAGGASSAAQPHTHPDAFVRLTLGDRTIHSFPVPNSLTPNWSYSFLLDPATVKQPAQLAVLDFDGGAGEEIGTTTIAAAELTKPGTHTVKFGEVKRLTFTVAALPKVVPVTQEIDVPSTVAMVDLATTPAHPAGTNWKAIPVAQGDLVEITAIGKVCPSDVQKASCTGPDGFADKWLKYNDPAFRTCDHCNHAALVAQLGLEAMAIGAHRRFVADTSGLLLLGVNDVKVAGNSGAYHVKVVINGEPAFAYGALDGERDDHAEMHEPVSAASLNPALIGETIDKHDDEIAACAQNASAGTIVLSFAIAGDGSLIGVNVVKADKGLKPIADCVRSHALKWKFPRPQGTVTVSFPLSFSQEQ
jgi:hypothetical protein